MRVVERGVQRAKRVFCDTAQPRPGAREGRESLGRFGRVPRRVREFYLGGLLGRGARPPSPARPAGARHGAPRGGQARAAYARITVWGLRGAPGRGGLAPAPRRPCVMRPHLGPLRLFAAQTCARRPGEPGAPCTRATQSRLPFGWLLHPRGGAAGWGGAGPAAPGSRARAPQSAPGSPAISPWERAAAAPRGGGGLGERARVGKVGAWDRGG
jgi:hypothetical protein